MASVKVPAWISQATRERPMTFVAALLLGVIAGLRAMTPIAAVCWAASLGILKLAGTPLAFLSVAWTPWAASLVALGELVTDQLPGTPSRKVPIQFGARLAMGAAAGWAVGLSGGAVLACVALGVLGAVAGTYGGAAGRAALTKAFGRDLPAALLEDLIAIGGSALVVAVLL